MTWHGQTNPEILGIRRIIWKPCRALEIALDQSASVRGPEAANLLVASPYLEHFVSKAAIEQTLYAKRPDILAKLLELNPHVPDFTLRTAADMAVDIDNHRFVRVLAAHNFGHDDAKRKLFMAEEVTRRAEFRMELQWPDVGETVADLRMLLMSRPKDKMTPIIELALIEHSFAVLRFILQDLEFRDLIRVSAHHNDSATLEALLVMGPALPWNAPRCLKRGPMFPRRRKPCPTKSSTGKPKTLVAHSPRSTTCSA